MCSQNAGVPGITSARSHREAVQAPGNETGLASVTADSSQVIESAKRLITVGKYGLQVLGLEGFGAIRFLAIAKFDANVAFEGQCACRPGRHRFG